MEIELKLELDPASGARALTASMFKGVRARKQTLVSHYFDTPAHDLRKAGFAIRIRHQGKTRIQTVKAEQGPAAGLFVRPEWEHRVAGDHPDLGPKSGPLKEIVGDEILGRIVRLFTTRVDRTLRTIALDGTTIEVAMDFGSVTDDGREAPIGEVELELKSGSPAALFDLARKLDAEAPVRIGVQSKSERGYALAARDRGKAVKAQPFDLSGTRTAEEAFVIIANACIRQFRLNETLLIETGNADALHQARVALRQFRTALRLFKDLFEGDEATAALKLRVKALATALGEVRNFDVLIPRLEGPARATLESARAKAFAALSENLQSREARLLMIDLAEWLAIGNWRSATGKHSPLRRDVRDFGTDTLERTRKRLRRKSRKLAKLDVEQRHDVRIEAKRLRYATEFFASLYPEGKARRRLKLFRRALAGVQDDLGELNDQAVGAELLARCGISEPLPVTPELEVASLLRQAENDLEALFDTKPFWRG